MESSEFRRLMCELSFHWVYIGPLTGIALHLQGGYRFSDWSPDQSQWLEKNSKLLYIYLFSRALNKLGIGKILFDLNIYETHILWRFSVPDILIKPNIALPSEMGVRESGNPWYYNHSPVVSFFQRKWGVHSFQQIFVITCVSPTKFINCSLKDLEVYLFAKQICQLKA